MSWSTPRTWSVGDVVTAAELNAVRDELREIWRLVEEKTATSTVNSTATTAAGADVLFTFTAFAADGVAPVFIEFGCAEVGVGNTFTAHIDYWDGSTNQGTFWSSAAGATYSVGVNQRTRTFVPSNASHTFSVRAWSTSAFTLNAGVGGAGTTDKMFARLWSKGGA